MPKSKKQKRIIKQITWNEVDMNNALLAVTSGNSIRSTAAKYGMSEGDLRYRMKLNEAGREVSTAGRHPTLDADAESQLAKCIGSLCRLGFSPTCDQIKDMVKDYVIEHNIKNPFTNNRPGKDWLRLFMERNNLSLKKANMISSARKSCTANPFIINDFYDTLEKIIEEHNLQPSQIRNCDDSGFPSDSQKCRVVSVKGETAYKVTCGAGRENTTTLAVCSAAGRALDPLIVFSGKNLQSTWRGENALPGTYYGISDSGWMTTQLFAEWFQLFTKEVKERPLLLLFDGHLTHISIAVLEKAIQEDVTIIKLPPHVTDKLQPLDVACFGPLKREWEKTLNNHISAVDPKQTMRTATFVDKLCEVWHKGLSSENIKSRFRATGIYPVDRTKFPADRIDPRLLKRYNRWVGLGRPENLMDELATSINTPQKIKPTESSNISAPATPALPATPLTTPIQIQHLTSTSTPSEICHCKNCQLLGPEPVTIPGKTWIPVWTLQDEKPSHSKSFDEIVLDKMKGPTEKPIVNRKKCDFKTKIVTDSSYVDEIKRLDTITKERKEQVEKRKELKLLKQKNQQKKEFESDSDDEDEIEDDEEVSSETEEEMTEDEDEVTAASDEESLISLWKSLSSPTKEEEVIQKWYGAIYMHKKKMHLYVGKVTRRFLYDEGGPVTAIELDCLKPRIESGTVLESYDNQHKDIDRFPIHNIIASISVIPLRNNKWDVPQYQTLEEKFKRMIKIDRELLF